MSEGTRQPAPMLGGPQPSDPRGASEGLEHVLSAESRYERLAPASPEEQVSSKSADPEFSVKCPVTKAFSDQSLPGSSPALSRAQERWRKLGLHVRTASAFSWKMQKEEGLLDDRTPPGPALDATRFRSGENVKVGKAVPGEARGRKRLEDLRVKQNRTWVAALQDSYVAALKMPPHIFFLAVFLTPFFLSLLFVPLYLGDIKGLDFEAGVLAHVNKRCEISHDATEALPTSFGPVEGGKDELLRLCKEHSRAAVRLFYVFLYSLSLSTTFGGTPVQAKSPYTLLVGNLQTMIAQFTFVFLSGAVFSRMSQHAQPVRCAKRAIIRPGDFVTAEGGKEPDTKHRCFAARMVLTGSMPVELVDVKISLTFRIFVRQPSGSIFCSTHALDVVRPEVAHLRYGLMVRHIIDENSPVYGHTKESLSAGDASFSLAVMGTERASMHSIFHMQDYFMADGDVIWNGDYLDFMTVSSKGVRVLDHTKLDMIRTFRAASSVPQAISRMKNAAKEAKGASVLAGTDGNKEPTNANGVGGLSRLASLRKQVQSLRFRKHSHESAALGRVEED